MRLGIFLWAMAVIVSQLGAAPADAVQNLLLDGDFELTDSRRGQRNHRLNSLHNRRWDVYDSLPGGWYTSSGSGIEVQYSGTVTHAASGNHYIELDSHNGASNSGMSLDVLFSGGDYALDFMYRPRTKHANDNGIEVLLDGHLLASVDGIRDHTTHWRRVSIDLDDVSAQQHTITFRAFGHQNTLGGFLDDVRLHKVTHNGGGAPVPEPSAAMLFGAGALLVARKRRREEG